MPRQMVNGAMELLHDQSLPTIGLLQSSFPNNKDFMINISTLFDPRYVFLIYTPILFAVNKRLAHRMVAALTLTEWANQILKWLLAGERPYWYVRERAHVLSNSSLGQEQLYDMQMPLDLKQFSVTCELGAGSPSGHAMVTATVWYILVEAYLKGELSLISRPDPSQISHLLTGKMAKLSWSMYTLVLVLVSLSRVYLACHFPHQCLCGALLGVIVARLVSERIPFERLTKGHYVMGTAGMFALVMGTYALLRSMGVNPLWSVDKAMRWCERKENIHLDTTPFFSMVRYLGVFAGAGLAYDTAKASGVQLQSRHSNGAHLLARRVIASLASIGLGQLLVSMPIPKSNLYLFYTISFILYAIFAFAAAETIPRLTKRLMGEPRTQHPKVE